MFYLINILQITIDIVYMAYLPTIPVCVGLSCTIRVAPGVHAKNWSNLSESTTTLINSYSCDHVRIRDNSWHTMSWLSSCCFSIHTRCISAVNRRSYHMGSTYKLECSNDIHWHMCCGILAHNYTWYNYSTYTCVKCKIASEIEVNTILHLKAIYMYDNLT